MTAARVVSEMRKDKSMGDVSLADLFENPTISQLANKIESEQQIRKEEVVEHEIPKKILGTIQYYFCALCQAFVALILVTLSPWHFFLILVLAISLISLLTQPNLTLLLIVWFAFLFLLEPVLILATIAIKWLLLGKIKPGKYKLWGWYYIRWWIVNQAHDLAPVDHLVGTPFITLFCRLMGAKIGHNCYIGTDNFSSYDLVSIDDNSSVGADVDISGFIIEDGWLKLGTIDIGKNCFVGTNSILSPNTRLEDNSKLGEQSLLSAGQSIPEGGSFVGSPSRPHVIDLPETPPAEKLSFLKKASLLFCNYWLLMLLEFIYVFSAVPGVGILVYYVFISENLTNCVWALPLGAFLYIGLLITQIFIFKKIVGTIKPGSFALNSFTYLRAWFSERLVALSLGAFESLYGTIFCSMFFRSLGAKIGKNSELSTVSFTQPDMVQIGKESFVADSTLIAPSRVYNGYIHLQPAILGDRVFIGNGALIPGNSKLDNNSLIAVSSLSPLEVPENTSWVGTPPIFLPHRFVERGVSESETYRPPLNARLLRGIIEFFRVYLPAFFLFLILTLDMAVFVILHRQFGWIISVLIFPFAAIANVLIEVFFIIFLKWVLIGRYEDSSKPMWKPFVSFSELITSLFDTVVVSFFLEAFLGTPIAGAFLRLFGAKIGRRTFIYTPYFSEFDLINIGDRVALNRECVLQTHLYEDRIFKMGIIEIEADATVGNRSIILYDAIMKQHSHLGSLSLLMKGEVIYPNSYFEGIPAKRVYKSKYT